MDESKHNPHPWGASDEWLIEPQDIALARMPAFGQRFFAEVFNEFPALAMGVVFLRWSVQPEDVVAVFELHDGRFQVQVDPCLEYLIVSGADGQAEYGDWDGDQVTPAVDHVRSLVIGSSPNAVE